MLDGMADVTQILSAIEQGDPHAAGQLLPLVYDELRRLAAQKLAQEKPGQTLQPTALVHEAYLRLVAGAAESAHAPHPRRSRPATTGGQARRRPAAGAPRRLRPAERIARRLAGHRRGPDAV